MSEKKQWIQHISGQGEKWPVSTEEGRHWRALDKDMIMWLPKSEYRLCDPPEAWRDCTEECEVVGNENNCTLKGPAGIVTTNKGYRLRKVQLWTLDKLNHVDAPQWAFIVEQKVQP